MSKRKFKKYAFEDIRTEYQPFDSTHVAPVIDIEARTVITFNSGTSISSSDDQPEVAAYETLIASSGTSVNNDSVRMLAEDLKKTDYGFVYYIIENNDNLVEED